jgi:dolichyl-phosphate-mannose-protein mannosyltransferase
MGMAARKKRSNVGHSPGWITVVGVIALSLPVCWPLFTSQLPAGHDALFYHPRLVEFHENIAHGILLPRWAPDLGAGAGQPLFIFSPPLPYYLAELWHLLGFDILVSLNLTAVIAIVASACFMFLFADYQFGRRAGWLATAAYLYAPYFHVDIFARHAFSELMAFPFYPLTLYGFSRYSRENKTTFLIVGAIAWAAILLSHNPSALLFSPLLLGFAVFLGWRNRSGRAIAGMLIAIAAGTALAAFVWLPALAESKFVYIERSLEATTNYLDHFVYPSQLWSTTWGFGRSITGSGDDLSFSFGWEHLLLIPLTGWLVFTGAKQALRSWFIVLTSALAVIAVMMAPVSMKAWGLLPLIRQVQFPWRLLTNGSVVISVIAAVYASALEQRRNAVVWFWAALALLVVPNLSHIGFEKYYPLIAAEWTPEAIAMNRIETTANAEFEPRWVQHRADYSENKISTVSGAATVSKVERTPTSWRMETNSSTEAILQVELLYFPGWTVLVDDTPVATQIDGAGRMQFRVPAGAHHVAVQFRRSAIRFTAELISALTFLALVFILWRKSFVGTQ